MCVCVPRNVSGFEIHNPPPSPHLSHDWCVPGSSGLRSVGPVFCVASTSGTRLMSAYRFQENKSVCDAQYSSSHDHIARYVRQVLLPSVSCSDSGSMDLCLHRSGGLAGLVARWVRWFWGSAGLVCRVVVLSGG